MPDTIGVSADAPCLAHWCRLVELSGMRAVAVPLLGTALRPVDRWLVALDRRDPASYLFWFRSLGLPMTVITTSMGGAYRLLDQAPFVRLICHTSRALVALGDVLAMAKNITAGSLVLGPVTPRVVRGEQPSLEGVCHAT